MRWPFSKKQSNDVECLVCNKKGEHSTEIQYSYKGGRGVAKICDNCAEHFDSLANVFGDDYGQPL